MPLQAIRNLPEADHNGSSRPVLVKLEDPVSTKLEPEEEIRDVEFYRFISKTLGKELFSSVQIT